MLHKAGKVIGKANTRAAELEAENARLKHQLDRLQSNRPKKRVAVNPNTQFANIDSIKQAFDKAAALQAV